MNKKGKLYICPTPIGNLEDITLRTVKVLQEVDFIACEDTRVTQKLLNHYDIKTKLISYHKFSEKEKSSYFINLLEQGNDVALVSDAGTPLINDPGTELIKRAYTASLKIIPLPGACSVTTALSAAYTSGLPFVFFGFLPKTRKEKEKLLFKYADINLIVFESPNRVVKTLEQIFEICGNIDITIARELTKVYEEIKRDSVENLLKHYSKTPPKGEFVLIIEGRKEKKSLSEEQISEKVTLLKQEGYGIKELSKIISVLYGLPKNQVYKLAVEIDE